MPATDYLSGGGDLAAERAARTQDLDRELGYDMAGYAARGVPAATIQQRQVQYGRDRQRMTDALDRDVSSGRMDPLYGMNSTRATIMRNTPSRTWMPEDSSGNPGSGSRHGWSGTPAGNGGYAPTGGYWEGGRWIGEDEQRRFEAARPVQGETSSPAPGRDYLSPRAGRAAPPNPGGGPSPAPSGLPSYLPGSPQEAAANHPEFAGTSITPNYAALGAQDLARRNADLLQRQNDQLEGRVNAERARARASDYAWQNNPDRPRTVNDRPAPDTNALYADQQSRNRAYSDQVNRFTRDRKDDILARLRASNTISGAYQSRSGPTRGANVPFSYSAPTSTASMEPYL